MRPIEANGDYRLAQGNNQYYIVDGNGVSIGLTNSQGGSVGPSNLSGGWSAVQVEEAADGLGGFEVLWSRTDGDGTVWNVWNVNGLGARQSVYRAEISEYEKTFEVDLNGDGYISPELTTIEANGDYTLAEDNNHYHVVDGNGYIIGLTDIHGRSVGPGSFASAGSSWNAVQVEKASDGGFRVMWSDVGSAALPPFAWKADASGTYQEHIFPTNAQYETMFKVDLNGDGYINPSLTTIEANGDYRLAQGNNQYYIVDGSGYITGLTNSQGGSVGPSNLSGGWSAVQVEEAADGLGGFEVLWSRTNGDGTVWNVWNVNGSGARQSTYRAETWEHEKTFEVDLNGDGSVGLRPIETNGDYILADGGNQYHIVDGNGVSIGLTNPQGRSLGPSNLSTGWSAIQVEEGSVSGFDVLLSHADGRMKVWKLDELGARQSVYRAEISEYEKTFEVDLNGDGYIGLRPIETNGDYILADGGNQYHIVDGNGVSIGLTNPQGRSLGPSNLSTGWSAIQVEEGSVSGFDVLLSHADGRMKVWKLDELGARQSVYRAEISEYEKTFEVDLNGDGYISPELTTIEANGDYTLAEDNNHYHVVDGNGYIIGLTDIHGRSVGPGSFASAGSSWNAVQVEKASDGGFRVMWSDVGSAALPPFAWKADASGTYQEHIFPTNAQYETMFKVDLNGDGYINPSLTTIEANGDYRLAQGNNQYYIVDGSGYITGLTNSQGGSVGPSNLSGGWSAVQVEEAADGLGGFEVLWSRTNGDGTVWNVWNVNGSGARQSTYRAETWEHEKTFEVDLNGDGSVGLRPIETNGDYILADGGNQYHIVDGNGVSIGLTNPQGRSLGPSNLSTGWSAIQVEEGSVSGFDVLLSHADGRMKVWKLDELGARQSVYRAEISEYEKTFEVDLNGDGYIGLAPEADHILIETNGDYSLAEGAEKNQNYIIDGSGNSIVLTDSFFCAAIRNGGWSPYQVEEDATVGFDVLWYADFYGVPDWPSYWSLKADTSGQYTGEYVLRSTENHEVIFEVDLDGDGYIGLPDGALLGHNGHSVITGSNKNDFIKGYAGNDNFAGGSGSDQIFGGPGDDILNGEDDDDFLTGGSGADTFIFNNTSGKDTIADFSGNDTIWIQSGADSIEDLQFTDTFSGLLIEFGDVDIELKGLNRQDINSSDFEFGI